MRFRFVIKIIICLLFAVGGDNILAQESVDTNYSFFLLSIDYSSNTNTFGVSNQNVVQPNYTLMANYTSKYNFDITYMPILTINGDTTNSIPAAEHTLSLGYDLRLGKHIDNYTSYSYTFHNHTVQTLSAQIDHIVQTILNYNNNQYYAYLGASYLMGYKNMFYLTLDNSYSFESKYIWEGKANVSFQPGVSINFGDKNFFNDYQISSLTEEQFLDNRKSMDYDRYLLIKQRIEDEKFNLEDFKKRIIENNPEIYAPKYTITSLDFNYPLYFTYKNLMLNFTVLLSIPVNTTEGFEQENSFLLSIGAGYAF